MKSLTPIQNRDALLGRLRLLPYQLAFAANHSRFKIGLWARQTGKDHTATAEAVLDCLFNPGTTWIILAAGERQALESLSKAKDWAEILKFGIDEYIESPPNLPLAQARVASTEIKWSNGSRLIALPANPHTIRGYSGNLILTEFAFHENSDAIWGAIYPSISNPLRSGPKKLRIISTPNGLTNKFANLWLNTPTLNPHPGPEAFPLPAKRGEGQGEGFVPFPLLPPVQNSSFESRTSHLSFAYHKSKITIHDAIRFGVPLNAAELQAGLNDPDAWSQEYLCEFMDSSSVLFPYDLIASCESEQATEFGSCPLSPASSQLFAGIDFGRKHHLTVCWILERVPAPPGFHSSFDTRNSHFFLTREVLTLKNTSTPDQVEILRSRLQRCRKICLDYTGAGIGLGDYLAREFGGCIPSPHEIGRGSGRGGKIELCQFTTALKCELFPRLRAAFEQRILRIPISREIREDLHAIQRTVTQSGQITYRAPQTADGHSDRTTALALALRAASTAPVSACATTISVPGRTADLRWALHAPRVSRRRMCL